MGDPILEDIQILEDPNDRDDQGGGRRRGKKDKYDNDRDGIKTSRPHYEGCILERLKPLPGETLSWRRCGRRWLPFTQDELVALVKKHRKLTNTKSADPDFKRLNGDKQGIINRIIEEKTLYEKSKTAEWTLVDVQPDERRVGWSKETIRLQIVIKRTEKGNDRNGYAASGSRSYSIEDVIDLSIPLEKKKDKNKDGKKNNKRQSNFVDPLDDPMNLGFGPNDLPPQNNNHNPPYDDHQPQWDPPNHPPPQAPFPPEWNPNAQPNPFDPHQQFPADPRASFPGGARDFGDPNPFYPQHHVAAPGQYDETYDNRDYIHPHQGGRARTRSAERDRNHGRSRSRRQSVARRPSRSRRRDSRRRDDSVEDMRNQFDRMTYRDDRDSSSSNYDERSMWSRSDGRYSRSPDTSVYSDEYPPRNRSMSYHRNSDSRPRYRSKRYHDAEVEPGYTYRRDNRDRRYSSRDLDRDRRPGLPHAVTTHYDDYPDGRAAEPRYLPAPPMQRRNTDIFSDKRTDYFDRDFQNWRQQPMDREQDAFEAGIRAERRRSTYYTS